MRAVTKNCESSCTGLILITIPWSTYVFINGPGRQAICLTIKYLLIVHTVVITHELCNLMNQTRFKYFSRRNIFEKMGLVHETTNYVCKM